MNTQSMKSFYINCALLCFVASLSAQTAPSGKDKNTEKVFDNLGYAKYAELRGQGEIMDYNVSVLDRMGTAYRKTGDSKNAEIVYGMLVENESERPEHYLYYAQALQSNMKYREAKNYFLLYDKIATKNSSETKLYNGAGKVYAQACDRISQFKAVGEVKIRNEKGINSARLDFSPMYYKDGIVFVSTRGQMKKGFTDKWINDKFMDLYYAPANNSSGSLENPENFDKDINSKYHEGPVSFADGEQTLFFTRNNYMQGKKGFSKDRVTKLKIYSARKVNDRWDEVRDLWFNSSEIDVCHPALSKDGKVFVFSRTSGNDGYGGMDLYVSFQLGSKWTAPRNLGPNINTAGNEVFPYIHDDGTLFFSSNGLAGLGGLDVFLADKMGTERDSLWGFPLNVGSPFNSSVDDFGFILNPEGTEGYFTSNREGGQGGDDIYSFKATPNLDRVLPRPTRPMTICVYDVATSKRIADAQVRIRPASSNPLANNNANINLNNLQNGITINLSPIKEGSDEYVLKLSNGNGNNSSAANNGFVSMTTDKKGTCQHYLPAGEEYVFEVLKSGYELATQTYTLSLKDFNGDLTEFCIPLTKGDGKMANNDPNNPNGNNLPYPDKLWTNGAVVSNPNFSNNPNEPKNPNYTKVPPDPNNPYNLPPDILNVPDNNPQLSAFVFNKDYNRPLPNTKVTILNRCTGEEKEVIVGESGIINYELECGCDYVLKATKDKFIGANKIISLSDKRNCQKLIPIELPMTPGFDKLGEPIVIGGNTINNSIKEGDLIELKNIFYDFDKYYIRTDASQDLDELYALLTRFPSMEIELSSHTDSRGSTQYNKTLSANRAKNAKEYLVKKGISSTRIKAVGYGESKTRNNCNDGVECSEFEHQRNRRTEVFVTKFDEAEYIKVRYDDNAPRVIDEKKN